MKLKHPQFSRRSKSFVIGSICILIGILLLCFNLGYLPIGLKFIVFSWPMLLILIGVFELCKRHYIGAGFLLIIGGYFLYPRIVTLYPDLPFQFDPTLLLPIGIILIGLLILFKRNNRPQKPCELEQKYESKEMYSSLENSKLNKNCVFGSGEHIVLDSEFYGGEVNVVCGSISLDLRKTHLPEGDTHLEVNSVLSSIIIRVPHDWAVEVSFDTVFGGFQDLRVPQTAVDASRKLIISGSCISGGGELKN